MQFKKEAFLTLITQLLCLGFAIGVSIVLNRVLGPTLKGEFVVLTLIPQFIVVFTSLGLGTSSSYFLGTKKFSEGDIVKSNLFAVAGIGILGIIIGYYIISLQFPNTNHSLYYILAGLVLFGLWLDNYLPDIFVGKGKVILYNKWNLFQSISKFCLICVLFICFKNKLYSAIIAVFIVNCVFFGLSFPVLSKIISLRGKVNFAYLSQGINFGYKVFIAGLLSFLNYRLDILMLRWMAGPTQVGYYSTAVGLAESLWIIPTSISIVLYSKIVTHEFDRSEITAKITRISLWITIVAGVVSIPLVKPIIILFYSRQFLPSLIPYLILLPGIIALSIPKLVTQETVGKWGKPEFSVYGMLIVVIVNIGLNLLLIPKMGMNGSALASTIAYIIQLIFFVALYHKLTHLRAREVLLLKKEDFAGWRIR
jgi:O-antigen/teichoic acid export membrane protein